MTNLQIQKNYPFLIELNLNKTIKRKFYFKQEIEAYTFFYTNLTKQISSISSKRINYYNAFLFNVVDGNKRLLTKKNLTRITL